MNTFSRFLIFIVLNSWILESVQCQILGEKMKEDSIQGMRLLQSTSGLIANWDFKSAIKNAEQARDIFESLWGAKHVLVADAWNQLGLSFYYYGDYIKAETALKQSHDIRVQLDEKNDYQTIIPLANLGLVYWRLGDFKRAEQLFLMTKAIAANAESLSKTRVEIINNAYNNLGMISMDKKQYLEASTLFIKAYQNVLQLRKLKVYDAYQSIPIEVRLLTNIASAYLYCDSVELAINTYEKVLKLAKDSLSGDIENQGGAYLGLSQCYTALGKHENSIEFAKIGTQLVAARLPQKHILVAKAYLTLVDAFQAGKQYHQADSVIYFALASLNYHGTNSLSDVIYIKELLQAMTGIAKYYQKRYISSKDIRQAYQARKYFNEAIAILNHQFKLLHPNAVSDFTEVAHDLYAGAISNYYSLYKATDSLAYKMAAFSFAGQTKGILLQQAIQASNAQVYYGISKELLEEEYQLRIAIAAVDKKKAALVDLKTLNVDAEFIEVYKEQEELNQRQDYLKQKLKLEYPKYYQAKYNTTPLNLKSIQDTLLMQDQSVLEYIVEDSSIYVFIVKKTALDMIQIKRDFPLEKWVRALTAEGVYAYEGKTPPKQPERIRMQRDSSYTLAAYQLFSKLIAPIQRYLSKKLIIIPDGVLGYIPFDALISNPPKAFRRFDTYPYLLHQYQISYCYSTTLLKEMKKNNLNLPPSKTPKIPFLGMAPFQTEGLDKYAYKGDGDLPFVKSDTLHPFSENSREVEVLNVLWKGAAYYRQEATKAQFIEKAPVARIIHLSTHAFGNATAGDYSFIAFRHPEFRNAYTKLFARDIYNLTLNAEMVTLSACQTSFGELQKGEGIISLARALVYAGAKSIVSSLWKVEDIVATDLMKSYYQYLMEGKPKDEALQLTKQDFLRTRTNERASQVHPFYWASFICFGDTSPLK